MLKALALQCHHRSGSEHSCIRRRLHSKPVCLSVFIPSGALQCSSLFLHLSVLLLLSGAGLGMWVGFCSDTNAEGPGTEKSSWKVGAQVALKTLVNNTTVLVATEKQLTRSSFCSGRGVSMHNGKFFSRENFPINCHCLFLL